MRINNFNINHSIFPPKFNWYDNKDSIGCESLTRKCFQSGRGLKNIRRSYCSPTRDGHNTGRGSFINDYVKDIFPTYDYMNQKYNLVEDPRLVMFNIKCEQTQFFWVNPTNGEKKWFMLCNTNFQHFKRWHNTWGPRKIFNNIVVVGILGIRIMPHSLKHTIGVV